MRKAQVFAEPFIIIFALIVAVLILAFGFKAVLDIQEKAKFAELLDAQAEIKEVSKTMYTLGVGSQRTIDLLLPKKITCLCFLDSSIDTINFPITATDIPSSCEQDRNILANIMNSNAGKYQLYFTPRKAYDITNFEIINQLKPISRVFCKQVANRKVSITLTSKGTHVELS